MDIKLLHLNLDQTIPSAPLSMAILPPDGDCEHQQHMLMLIQYCMYGENNKQ